MGSGCGGRVIRCHWTDTIMSMPSGKQPVPGPFARAFSAHIRLVMSRERINITTLAGAAGLSRSYLGKRLRDEVAFTLNDVEVLCEVLGESLMGGLQAAAKSIEE